jgi:O-methyltransferase involved in polyketide biosynthesis
LAAAVARGATQYVVLGAGLDGFADRDAYSRLRVFAVEHAASEPVGAALRSAGFADGEISFFSWLGAKLQLTAEAALATLGFIGSRPEGSSLVFDYAAVDALASRFGRAGEPVRILVDPGALKGVLRAAGFRQIEDLGGAEAHLVHARV